MGISCNAFATSPSSPSRSATVSASSAPIGCWPMSAAVVQTLGLPILPAIPSKVRPFSRLASSTSSVASSRTTATPSSTMLQADILPTLLFAAPSCSNILSGGPPHPVFGPSAQNLPLVGPRIRPLGQTCPASSVGPQPLVLVPDVDQGARSRRPARERDAERGAPGGDEPGRRRPEERQLDG